MWNRVAAVLAAVALAASPAAAEDPARRGFDPDPARLALSLDGGFAAETAGVAPRGTFGAAAVLDLASGLLALKLGPERSQLLERRLSLQLLAGASLGRVEIGANLPIALYQRSDLSLLERQGVTGPLVDPVARTALGDLRVAAKLAVLDGAAWPVALAGMLDLRLPTGDPKAFTSGGLAVVPSAIATRAFGRLRLDGQLGYDVRGTGQYAQLVVHDGLVYALGASMDLPAAGPLRRWRALAELTGGWPRGYRASGERYRAPLSARAGLRWFARDGLAVEAGGGAGLGEAGYGREAWRIFAGVRWTRAGRGPGSPAHPAAAAPSGDADRDGVPDERDQCPTEPGSAELDGCPDADADAVPDREDRCPHEKGPLENGGCPLVEGEPLVEIETERLSLKDAIHFDVAMDTIKPESFRILDEVAAVIASHPELARIRVEGHTDDVGTAAYNKDLSERRAGAVVRYLAGKGIPRERLEPKGYGFERPVATNATAVGRARNRRVEFTILGEEGR